MLRHLLRELEWGIILAIATLILFLIIANLTIEPVIATITETEIAPGQTHCCSERVLIDEEGHKWQVMLFANIGSPQVTSLNLRLSGLSSSLRIQPQKPLVINTSSNCYQANDIFLEGSPLPSIGQYDLKNIVPQLPAEKILLELPIESGTSARLHIPKSLVEEWQEIAANLNPPQKLPSGFQLTC